MDLRTAEAIRDLGFRLLAEAAQPGFEHLKVRVPTPKAAFNGSSYTTSVWVDLLHSDPRDSSDILLTNQYPAAAKRQDEILVALSIVGCTIEDAEAVRLVVFLQEQAERNKRKRHVGIDPALGSCNSVRSVFTVDTKDISPEKAEQAVEKLRKRFRDLTANPLMIDEDVFVHDEVTVETSEVFGLEIPCVQRAVFSDGRDWVYPVVSLASLPETALQALQERVLKTFPGAVWVADEELVKVELDWALKGDGITIEDLVYLKMTPGPAFDREHKAEVTLPDGARVAFKRLDAPTTKKLSANKPRVKWAKDALHNLLSPRKSLQDIAREVFPVQELLSKDPVFCKDWLAENQAKQTRTRPSLPTTDAEEAEARFQTRMEDIKVAVWGDPQLNSAIKGVKFFRGSGQVVFEFTASQVAFSKSELTRLPLSSIRSRLHQILDDNIRKEAARILKQESPDPFR
jgi:hypothetical protein